MVTFIKENSITLLFMSLYFIGFMTNLISGHIAFGLFCGLAFIINGILFYKRLRLKEKRD